MSVVRTAAGALCGTVVGLVPAGAVVGVATAAGGDTSGMALGVTVLFALVGIAVGGPVGGLIARRTKPKPEVKAEAHKR